MRRGLLGTALGLAGVLIAPAARAQDVSFEPTRYFGVGREPYSVAVGDFNGDGLPDLAVALHGSNAVSVLLGNGDGSFQGPRYFVTGLGPYSVAVGDFNGDALLDLAVANANSDSVSVLRGNGDGTFQASRSFGVGSSPHSVAVSDLDGDGLPDLVVANFGYDHCIRYDEEGYCLEYERLGESVSVLPGNGDGTFQLARNFGGGSRPIFVAVEDFNGDGLPDLAVANNSDPFGTVSVLLGNGDGSFQAATAFATADRYPATLALADFNGDGISDLAVANHGGGVTGSVSVLLGNGDGSFQGPMRFYVSRGNPNSVAVGDFNGDGVTDLAVADYRSGTASVLLGRGDGSFQAAISFPAGGGPYCVAVADFNGDGLPDLAVANGNSSDVSVLINNTPR